MRKLLPHLQKPYIWVQLSWMGLLMSIVGILIFEGSKSTDCIFSDSYYWKVIVFTFVQASITAVLCIIISLLAVQTFRKLTKIPAGRFMQDLLSIPYYIPGIVACLAWVILWGQSGLVNRILTQWGFTYHTFLYGLGGIVMCHLFYYVPFVLRALYRALQFLPSENERMAQLIGLKGWHYFRLILWPLLRGELGRLFFLVLLYCAGSFTTILVFGGAPSSTTIEIALYQSIYFDRNVPLAAQLALVQFLINLGLFYGFFHFQSRHRIKNTKARFPNREKFAFYDYCVVLLLSLLLIAPIITLFWYGLDVAVLREVVQGSLFWKALLTSLGMGIGTTFLAIMIALAYVVFAYWFNHRSKLRQQTWQGWLIDVVAQLSLMLSPVVLGLGLIEIAYQFYHDRMILFCLVVVFNVVAVLPTMYRVLYLPYAHQRNTYNQLCSLLNMKGSWRILYIDWPTLKPIIGYAIVTSLLFSIGDIRSILCFNAHQVTNLTALVYDYMHQYQFEKASTVACLMIACNGVIFWGARALFSKKV